MDKDGRIVLGNLLLHTLLVTYLLVTYLLIIYSIVKFSQGKLCFYTSSGRANSMKRRDLVENAYKSIPFIATGQEFEKSSN